MVHCFIAQNELEFLSSNISWSLLLTTVCFATLSTCDKIKAPKGANQNDVCLQNTNKSHSYHLKTW